MRTLTYSPMHDCYLLEEDGEILEKLPPWIGGSLAREWAELELEMSKAGLTWTHRATGEKFGRGSGRIINEHLWDEPPPAWTQMPCPDAILNMQLMSDAPIGRYSH